MIHAPCTLVSKADVAKALGTNVTSTEEHAIGPSHSCTFHTSQSMTMVIVTVLEYPSDAAAHAAYLTGRSQSASAYEQPAKPLSGIGDEAYSIAKLTTVRKHSTMFTVNAIDAHSPTSMLGEAVAIARAAGLTR